MVILVFAVSLAGCGGKGEGTSGTSDSDIRVIGHTELHGLIENGALVIDVRVDKQSYDTEHIPGAIHIPMYKLNGSDPRLIDRDAIVVYGSGSTDHLSAASCKKLMRLRYPNVFDFRGGIGQWKRNKGEVESTKE